jgi:hypothetical protein
LAVCAGQIQADHAEVRPDNPLPRDTAAPLPWRAPRRFPMPNVGRQIAASVSASGDVMLACGSLRARPSSTVPPLKRPAAGPGHQARALRPRPPARKHACQEKGRAMGFHRRPGPDPVRGARAPLQLLSQPGAAARDTVDIGEGNADVFQLALGQARKGAAGLVGHVLRAKAADQAPEGGGGLAQGEAGRNGVGMGQH